MAYQALVPRFIRTWWIWLESASTVGESAARDTWKSIVVGSVARRSFTVSSTTGRRLIGWRSCFCCRLNVSIWRTSPVALAAAWSTDPRYERTRGFPSTVMSASSV